MKKSFFAGLLSTTARAFKSASPVKPTAWSMHMIMSVLADINANNDCGMVVTARFVNCEVIHEPDTKILIVPTINAPKVKHSLCQN